ncbi:hypothetical protein DSO57_1022362 [Entomophthora muscae]|uniref:Uncharacterized protein n=1 Tax=Entomophthora muscae TaxID=34485 RepID=A0ACC2TDY0_9FUNG|nr:hypothetical protein DSO57_1022362 [Entomophthora muscae]
MKSELLLGFVLAGVQCHSNMFYPKPRGNLQWWGYCSRGENCKTACDSPKNKANIGPGTLIVKRGDKMTVKWKRQNHPGGFVRLAMVPLKDSDEESKFDSNPIKYVCYETNCKESVHQEILGKNNGPGDGLCSTDIHIPGNLHDGPVTLQWKWYGGGVYYADRNTSFAHYVSCADLRVQGGTKSGAKPKPVFKGGDVATSRNDQCRYWSTDSVHKCPLGAEDKNKNGCGYRKPEKFGPPEEWLSAPGHVLE